MSFQSEYTTNKHGMLVPVGVCGDALLVKLAELTGQLDQLNGMAVNMVREVILY